jgi:hypothetical protein
MKICLKKRILLEEFENEAELTNLIENQITETKSWIRENDFPEIAERPDRKLGSRSPYKLTDLSYQEVSLML